MDDIANRTTRSSRSSGTPRLSRGPPPQLGKSFAVTPQAKELVTLGLYSRIRNPIYVFVDVMIFGLIVAQHLYWLFALYPLLVAMHVFRAHREAKVLQVKFGQAYLDYQNQTWF